MKRIVFFSFIFVFFQINPSYGYFIQKVRSGGSGGTNFQIYGSETVNFGSIIAHHFHKKYKSNYPHKFNSVKIPGITRELNIRIHEGVSGPSHNGVSYFKGYKNVSEKQARLDQNITNETHAIMIYISLNQKYHYAIQTQEDVLRAEEFLCELFDA